MNFKNFFLKFIVQYFLIKDNKLLDKVKKKLIKITS